jgi:hypothetical protein
VSRRGKTYAKIARELIAQGHELARNGNDLLEIEERMGGLVDNEARLRMLAGGVVADVGRIMLMDRQHRSTMRKLRKVGRLVKDAIARSQIEEEP